MTQDSGSTGAWERSLILISVAVTLLGLGLGLVFLLLSLPDEFLQKSWGGLLAPPRNVTVSFVLMFSMAALGVFAIRSEKQALKTDPAARGSKYVERALWRRVVITLPLTLWSTGCVWLFFLPSQVDKEQHSRTALDIILTPTLFQALVLYVVPLLVTLFGFFRLSRERRPGDEYYESSQ